MISTDTIDFSLPPACFLSEVPVLPSLHLKRKFRKTGKVFQELKSWPTNEECDGERDSFGQGTLLKWPIRWPAWSESKRQGLMCGRPCSSTLFLSVIILERKYGFGFMCRLVLKKWRNNININNHYWWSSYWVSTGQNTLQTFRHLSSWLNFLHKTCRLKKIFFSKNRVRKLKKKFSLAFPPLTRKLKLTDKW